MPKPNRTGHNVGDHVADPDGIERIVTDICKDKLILRPLRGAYKEFPTEPSQVTRLSSPRCASS